MNRIGGFNKREKSGNLCELDIGTTSIKVVVAEYVRGQLNIIGVGNEKSEGLSRGVIVDIDETVEIYYAKQFVKQNKNQTFKSRMLSLEFQVIKSQSNLATV